MTQRSGLPARLTDSAGIKLGGITSERCFSRKRGCEHALAEVLNGGAEQNSQADDLFLSAR